MSVVVFFGAPVSRQTRYLCFYFLFLFTNCVCQALELPVIPPAELQFLKDYCSVGKPVSTAIDILQGAKTATKAVSCQPSSR